MKKHTHDTVAAPGTEQKQGTHPASAGIEKRYGANLPHWTKDGAWNSITFRLFDSVPQSVLRSWRFERQNIVNTAHKMNRPLSEREEARLRKLYSEKIESYLDAGFGACYLRNDKIAEVVANALEFFDGVRYRLAAWCVMPNHVHVVVEPLIGFELPGILHSWKSFTSKEANKILGRRGAFWQVEAYDHLIRNEVDFDHAVKYVLANPFNAGLKNWKWVGGSEITSLP